MVTKADQLAHSVDGFVVVEPGVVHDPALPLVLGDTVNNKYANLSYDAIAGALRVLVVNGLSSSILTFDDDGSLLLNGVPISESGDLQAIVAQAQLAAQQAQASSLVATEAATLATSKAQFVAESVGEAETAAALAAQFASAAPGTDLPGGGNSSATSAQIADQIAQESRELQQSDPVTTSETFSAGFFDTERRVTTTSSINITLPAGLHTSTEKRAKWAAYKLCAASGSVTAVPAGGTSGFITPNIVKNQREHFRVLSPGVGSRHTIAMVLVAVPAVTDGMLIVVAHAMHRDVTILPTINITCSLAGTIQTLKAPKSPSAQQGYPTSAVYMLPIASFAGGTNITVTVDEGPDSFYQSVEAWVISNAGVGVPVVVASTENTLLAQFNATQVGLQAQSLVLATAEQGINSTIAGAGFSSFSANLNSHQSGNTYGSPDVLVSDTENRCNTAWAYGYGVAATAGNFAMSANFATATGRGTLTTISIPPKVGAGGDVVLKAEGGRTALTVPYGVMEIWAQPDGVTYEIRTSKP